MPIRVLVADGHPLARAGFLALFTGTEFEVVAQAADCSQAMKYTLTCEPDFVLLDLQMPGGNALEIMKQIKAARPNVRVLIFSAAESIPAMIQAFRLGADGYLFKSMKGKEILSILRRIVQNRTGWSRRQLRQIGTAKRCRYRSLCPPLTEREAQVLEQIAAGHNNEEIGENLGIDPETVKQHVQSVLRKLGLKDRTQAAYWAIRNACGASV